MVNTFSNDYLDCDVLTHWSKYTEIQLLICTNNGEILWCNPAFEDFIGYTNWELTRGSETGITIDSISVNDEAQKANTEMAFQCVSGTRISYNVTRQLIPKNEKPVWCHINVVRYPLDGEFKFFLVAVSPMKNGSLAAFNLSMEKTATMAAQLEVLENKLSSIPTSVIENMNKLYPVDQYKVTPLTEMMRGLGKLMEKYPKYSIFSLVILLIMILGPQLVKAIETVKVLITGP